MDELLRESMGKKGKFSAQEIELLKSYFIDKKIRKRQYVLNLGYPCQYVFVVEKGMLRSFTVDDEGHEHVVQFAIEGWWIADMGSFLSGKEAIYNIEALEDSEVLNLSKQAMEEMMKQLLAMERYFMLLMQNNIVALQRRVDVFMYIYVEENDVM